MLPRPTITVGPSRHGPPGLSLFTFLFQVSFISGIPVDIHVNGESIPSVEINFLCIHKKLRSKRLAPLLIKEVTRRVNLHGIWQAAYTAGVVLPKPVATCRYWHRSINPRKLVDVGFSQLSARGTMQRLIKLNRLPDQPQTPGVPSLFWTYTVRLQGPASKRMATAVSLQAQALHKYCLLCNFDSNMAMLAEVFPSMPSLNCCMFEQHERFA